MRPFALAGVAALLAACTAPPTPPPVAPPSASSVAVAEAAAPTASPPPPPRAEATAAPATSSEADAKVAAMLERVARIRGLPPSRPVATRVLDRDAMLARIRAHVEREVPKETLALQGEVLTALDLVPPDYDYVGGMYALVGGRVAGFYEPEAGEMVLADDLGDEEAEETLAHELVHALQDQRYDLGALLKFAPGEGERLAAAHALAEGDATSAMLDVALGSAFNVSEAALRRMLVLSTALSGVGAKTPRVLQSSLVAPYVDGFALVQALRREGGWSAVDAKGWRGRLTTTEQVLHVEKLLAGEPAVAVAAPKDALGPSFEARVEDTFGEQGLRLWLEDWTDRDTARVAAAGWGGDRYAVLVRDDAKGRSLAVAARIAMDTAADARELANVLAKRLGRTCRERAATGPVAWRLRGKELGLVAGPYLRDGLRVASAGSCAEAAKALDATLR